MKPSCPHRARNLVTFFALMAAARSLVFLRIASDLFARTPARGPRHTLPARWSCRAVALITVRFSSFQSGLKNAIFFHGAPACHPSNAGSREFPPSCLIIAATVSKLNVVVLYDGGRPETAEAPSGDRAPITRTLDRRSRRRSGRDLGKLGHEAVLHVLDGSIKSLHALAKMNAIWSSIFGVVRRERHRGLLHRRLSELVGSGSPDPDPTVCSTARISRRQEDPEFHARDAVFARSFRGRLDFSHDLEFPSSSNRRARMVPSESNSMPWSRRSAS